jgi:hypothetical protein
MYRKFREMWPRPIEWCHGSADTAVGDDFLYYK